MGGPRTITDDNLQSNGQPTCREYVKGILLHFSSNREVVRVSMELEEIYAHVVIPNIRSFQR